jgi:hypothetical protein
VILGGLARPDLPRSFQLKGRGRGLQANSVAVERIDQATRQATRACHVTARLALNHGHSRGIESVRDLGIRRLQQAGKCPPRQQVILLCHIHGPGM